MVTREQFIKGFLAYADKEIIPQLPTAGKWGLGSLIILSKDKANDVLCELSKNPFVQSLGLMNEDGLIDIELLANALKQTANKYGKCELSIPMMGNMTFSANDVEMLTNYIVGGNNG